MTPASDIFAVGTVIFEWIFETEHPHHLFGSASDNLYTKMVKMVRDVASREFPSGRFISNELKDVLQQCLKP
jgi:hypothetical protein